MKSLKIKTLLLVSVLIFVLSVDLQAQDKYEYAVISFIPRFRDLEVSINGVSYQKLSVVKEKVKPT